MQSRFRIAQLAEDDPPALVRVRPPALGPARDKLPVAYPDIRTDRAAWAEASRSSRDDGRIKVSFPSNVVPFPGSESYLTSTELHQVSPGLHASRALYADYQNTPRICGSAC